jgi:hypothetical protein
LRDFNFPKLGNLNLPVSAVYQATPHPTRTDETYFVRSFLFNVIVFAST